VVTWQKPKATATDSSICVCVMYFLFTVLHKMFFHLIPSSVFFFLLLLHTQKTFLLNVYYNKNQVTLNNIVTIVT
jgi:hypothetical protein